MSAHAVHKPDNIYIYNEKEPENNYLWESIRKYVTIVHMTAPTEFQGIKLTSFQYKADITRMEKLIELGGIYMDIDIISLKPFGNLLTNYDCVVGAESCDDSDTTDINKFGSITNAVLLSKANHPYIKKWYNEIATNIEGKVWAYHAVCLPLKLLKEENYESVHVVPKKSFMPFCFRDSYVFNNYDKNRVTELDESHTIHLWETIWMRDILSYIDVGYFNTNDNIFVDICRSYLTRLNENISVLENIIKSCYDNHKLDILKYWANMYCDICESFDTKPNFSTCQYYLYTTLISSDKISNNRIHAFIVQNFDDSERKVIDLKSFKL